MRIGIISRGKKNYSTLRLIKAANELDHRVTVMNPWDCTMYIAAGGPAITHNERSVEGLDVIIARLGTATAEYGLEVVSHFEHVGVPAVNGATAIETARHKWRSLRVLSEHGLPVPATFLAGAVDDLDRGIKRVGGYPLITKPFEGTQGSGIMLFETPLTMKSALHAFWSMGKNFIAQEFSPEASGRDIRVLVVGGQVIGAMERIAAEGDFRANLHRGGQARAIRVSEEMADLAVRSADALDLGISGVDMLRLGDELVVLEVNPSPGFEGFEEATRRDVARVMIKHAEVVAANA
jgi:ribosomal protein S6--L-glutamate ligase